MNDMMIRSIDLKSGDFIISIHRSLKNNIDIVQPRIFPGVLVIDVKGPPFEGGSTYVKVIGSTIYDFFLSGNTVLKIVRR